MYTVQEYRSGYDHDRWSGLGKTKRVIILFINFIIHKGVNQSVSQLVFDEYRQCIRHCLGAGAVFRMNPYTRMAAPGQQEFSFIVFTAIFLVPRTVIDTW